jgi:hypothetical protein
MGKAAARSPGIDHGGFAEENVKIRPLTHPKIFARMGFDGKRR